jgi:uncharacterized membrane protein
MNKQAIIWIITIAIIILVVTMFLFNTNTNTSTQEQTGDSGDINTPEATQADTTEDVFNAIDEAIDNF